MPCYHYRIVNVFAESAFGGNPLCVFENASGMDDGTMLALARQFNLSETTFILPSDHADARMRIFTPVTELRFAGHPTLGTAHVVRSVLGNKNDLHLECAAGVIPVVANRNDAAVWTFTAPARLPEGHGVRPVDVPAADITRLLGLQEDDLLDRPQWVDTGNEQLLVPLKSIHALRQARPDNHWLAAWPTNKAGRKTAYLFAFDGTTRQDSVQARYFFATANGGIAEDPGTGSACANLGGWLIATGAPLPAQLRVEQGDAIQRPCCLRLEVSAQHAIHVGGRVIELGRGTIDL